MALHLFFSGLLQIQISLKQSSKTRDKWLKNKLCFLQIGLDVFVIQFKPTYSLKSGVANHSSPQLSRICRLKICFDGLVIAVRIASNR